ncbi:family 16 glycosylhydrolase [Paraglaciecola sp. L3A3]|uniref:family 16 glycosylhydrolase n=1 Tax=Paraglaciecola sp. L3A3 TaxID=2686358 RepID=UPI00131A6DD0|nr:family 16 glycosylhydrolase [Paraglaciecola sp. L3A3]
MLTKKNKLTILVLTIFTANVSAEPPRPPLGKKWVLNEQFSDEFNGTELDKSKWFDYHPTWAGREPGIFLPSQVSVKDGLMRIKGERLNPEKVITSADIVTSEGTERRYSVAGGAVISKTEEAFFGYYESRFKSAKTTMSTTFWLATRNWDFEGPKPCKDRYGLELDIQETIGRQGDFKGKHFAKGMHANGHFWYAGCDEKMQDFRASEVKYSGNELTSDNFNTYGGWWHDESSASFYYNNERPKFMTFYSAIKDKPFDQPMGVNLVSETYPFPWIELPNDAELNDPNKNVAYYDWVRSYILVNALSPNENTSKPAVPIYGESAGIIENSFSLKDSKTLDFQVTYQVNDKRIIEFTLHDEHGNRLSNKRITVDPGYAFIPFTLSSNKSLSTAKGYQLTTSILPANSQLPLAPVFLKTRQITSIKTPLSRQKLLENLAELIPSEEDTLAIPGDTAVYQYTILDINGSEAKTGIVYNNTLDLNRLTKGQYLLKLDGSYFAKFSK